MQILSIFLPSIMSYKKWSNGKYITGTVLETIKITLIKESYVL